MKRTALLSVLSVAMGAAASPSGAFAEGSVKAKVMKAGERCRRTVVKMDADPFCARAHEGKVGSEECIVSKDGEVMNAVVYIKDGLGDKKFDTPSEAVLLDQEGCMYKPHILTVQTDQVITVRNSDDTLHNIHSFAERQRSFNFAQPKKGMTKEVTFKRPEFVKVKCDVHPWMSAHIAVFEHPFHTVTNKDGQCELANLPAGEYTFGCWHEEYGELEQKVTVKDGEPVEVEFTYEG